MNLISLFEHVDRHLKESKFLTDVCLLMTGNEITFKTKQESDDHKWSIIPATDVCEIERDDIEAYNGAQSPPKVLYYINPKINPSVRFIHSFGLEGTKEKKLTFCGPPLNDEDDGTNLSTKTALYVTSKLIVADNDESSDNGLHSDNSNFKIKQDFSLDTLDTENVNQKKKEIQAIIRKENNSEYVQGIVIAVGIKSQVENIELTFEQMGYIVFREFDLSCSSIACLVQAAAVSVYPDNIKYIIFYFAGYGGTDRSGNLFIEGMLGLESAQILPIEKYVFEPLRKLKLIRLFLFDCYRSSINVPQIATVQPQFFDTEVVALALHKFQSACFWTTYLCDNLKNKAPIGAILENVFKNDTDLVYSICHCNLNTIIYEGMVKLEYVQAFKQAIKENGKIECSVVQCMPFGPPRVGKTHFYHTLLGKEYVDKNSTGVIDDKGIIRIALNQISEQVSTRTCIVKSDSTWESIEDLDEEIYLYLETIRSKSSGYTTESNNNAEGEPVINEVDDTVSSKVDDASDTTNGGNLSDVAHDGDASGSSIKDSSLTSNIEDTSINPDTKHQVQEEINEHKSTSARSTQDGHTSTVEGGTSISRKQISDNQDNNHSHQLTEGIPVPEKLQRLFRNSAIMFYTDTGGQPEFQEVLPCIVGGPMLFVLMFNLSTELDRVYTVEYHSSEKCKPYKSTFTVKQVLMQYLSSILSYCNGLEDPYLVKIVILATHKDKVSNCCKRQKIQNVNKSLKEANEVKTAINEGLLIKFHNGLVMIPIDNNDTNDVEEVKEIIEAALIEENSKYRQPVPVNWLGFGLALRKIESSVVPLSECRSLAKRYSIGEKDFLKVLFHFHQKMGVIRYYDANEQLKNTVITKPAVLFKAITKLIVATFNHDNLHYGYFMKKEVESIFDSQLQKNEDGLKLVYFLALLEHLNILVPAEIIGNKKFDYFLPCALSHARPSVLGRIEEYPLLLSFCSHSDSCEVKFVPTGFFSSLIGFLQKKSWSITIANDRPCHYRNQIIFSARVNGNGNPFKMKVELKVHYVEFMIMEIKGDENTSSPHRNRQRVCQYVRDLLQKNVPDICKKLQCTELITIFGLYCSDCKPSRSRYRILNWFLSKELPHFAGHISESRLGMQCLRTKEHYDLKREDVARFWFEQEDIPEDEETHPVKVKPPDYRDVLKKISQKRNDWYEIGDRLKVDRTHLQEFDGKNINAYGKLEHVLYKWEESQCSEISWDNIITVCEALQYNDIVEELTGHRKGQRMNTSESPATNSQPHPPARCSILWWLIVFAACALFVSPLIYSSLSVICHQ